jgi:hypothetical protein
MFLQGAGGTLLAIPFLASLLPRNTWAQSTTVPKRYFSLSSNYDYGHARHWYPTLGPLSQTLQKPGEAPVTYQTLRSLLGNRPALSKVLGPGLTPHIDSINLLRGLDFIEYYGHGFGHQIGSLGGYTSNDLLNGLPLMMTLDQVLGRNARFNPNASEPFLASNVQGSISMGPDASGRIIRRYASASSTPQAIYQTLFRSGAVAETGQTTIAHPRRDVLSRVLDDYRRVRAGSQISSLDKMVLDNALDKLSEVQRNIAADTQSTNGCSYKTISRTGGTSNYDSVTNLKNMADLLVAGMMCDLNRSFQFTGQITDDYYNRSNEQFHNGHSHSPLQMVAGKLNHEYLSEIQAQLVANFLTPLLNGMASAIDAQNGKSILYNSLVHFTIESGAVHSFSDAPNLLAGNAGGAITSGHMIDYTNSTIFDGPFNVPTEGGWSGDPKSPNFVGYLHGLPVNRAFNTILQAMGLQRSDYERTDINQWYRNRTDGVIGVQNNNISEVGGYGYVGAPDATKSSWEMYGHHRYHDYNLNFFKDTLAMPSTNAA